MVHKLKKLSANYRHKWTILLLTSLLLMVCIVSSYAETYDISSPNEKIQAFVEDGAQLTFR